MFPLDSSDMDKFIFNENSQTWENYLSNIKKLLTQTCFTTNDSIIEDKNNKMDKSYLSNISNEGKDENIRQLESEGSEDLLGNSFISYINILSDSIKEYYKISIDIIENKMVLFNKIQSEIYSSIP